MTEGANKRKKEYMLCNLFELVLDYIQKSMLNYSTRVMPVVRATSHLSWKRIKKLVFIYEMNSVMEIPDEHLLNSEAVFVSFWRMALIKERIIGVIGAEYKY